MRGVFFLFLNKDNQIMTTATPTKPKTKKAESTLPYSCMGISFDIHETRFGLFVSTMKDGTEMVTALTREACLLCTERIHIPSMKGCFEGYVSESRSAVVGGKL
jgi:hypothetical protein